MHRRGSAGRHLLPRQLWLGALCSLLLACGAPGDGRDASPSLPAAGGGGHTSAPVVATASGPPQITVDPDASGQPVARAVRGGPPVRLAPDDASPVISGLYFDAALPLLEERSAADGARWYRTRLWGVLEGWIKAEHVTTEPSPPVRPFYEGPQPARRPSPVPSPSRTLQATGLTTDEVNLRTGPGTGYRSPGRLPGGSSVAVRAWATDERGQAWYEVAAGERVGWVYAALVDLQFADPKQPMVDGRPLAYLVSGKGMWLPQPLLEMADAAQIVEAARRLGLSHIFVEAGETAGGFYARKDVARLLPAAHAGGVRVIAWLTTGLFDLPRDVELSVEVATYRTPEGHGFDGIAPDIEQNMQRDAVKAYAEITRARLGDDRLIVGVVYPAGGWFGREYPIYSILARAFNVLAPMAYWSDKQRDYSYDEVYAYTFRAVQDMRAAAGSDYPVHLIGQMYDTFGRNGTGAHSPDREDVQAALQAARDAGAVGASFFQWGTATPEEWAALRDFAWQ